MKLRTRLFFFALLPVLVQAAVAQTETPVAEAPRPDTVAAQQAATDTTDTPDDALSGLADTRLAASQSAPELSLTEVIALALQDNPERKENWAAYDAALARIGIAKSAGGPQVNLNGSVNTQRGFGFSNNATSGGTDTSSTNPRRWSDSQELSISADIPIYNGGRVKADKRSAQHIAQAQFAQARSFEQTLVYNTAVTYLDVLRGQQLLAVSDSNLAVARERRRIAGVRFDAGAAARLEVLRAETDLANARQTRISSSNNLGQSMSRLNTLMGREPETPIRIEPIISLTLPEPLFITTNANAGIVPNTLAVPNTGTGQNTGGVPNTSIVPNPGGVPNTDTVPSAGGASNPGSVPNIGGTPSTGAASSTSGVVTQIGMITTAPAGDLRGAAFGGRQSLAATQARIRSAEANVDVAKAGKKPNIGLDILGLIRNPISFAGRFLLSLGGSLVQNLFDSGRTRSQVREAQAIVQQLRAQATREEQAVANEIEQSLLLLDSSQKRLASADTGVVAAREALRAAQLGYSAGAQTALEVSDAQSALLTAETEAVNARFDVAAAQAQLSAAVGVYPSEAVAAYQTVVQQEKANQEQEKENQKKKKK
jgi:outer membrane protein TolC